MKGKHSIKNKSIDIPSNPETKTGIYAFKMLNIEIDILLYLRLNYIKHLQK